MNEAIKELAEAIQAVRDAGLDYRISDVCASVKTDAQSLWITQIHDGTDADRGRALYNAFEQWKAKYGAKPGPDTVPRADYDAVCKDLDEARKDIKWLRAMSPANQLMPVGSGTLPVNWDGMQTLLARALKAEEEREEAKGHAAKWIAALHDIVESLGGTAVDSVRESKRLVEDLLAERDALRGKLDAARAYGNNVPREWYDHLEAAYNFVCKERSEARAEVAQLQAQLDCCAAQKTLELHAERDALRAELDALRERTLSLEALDARLRKLEDGTV